jgi:iron complex outermembrane receptor protein
VPAAPLPFSPTTVADRIDRRLSLRAIAIAAMLAAATPAALAQSNAPPASVEQLKQMSLDDLMQTEVTSASRHPESLLDSASAIQVLTSEDIEESGAVTIPEALQMADNLDIAQKDPHDWAISARGFNSNLGDKMLVLMDGRSVYTPLFSGVFWNAEDYLMEDVDRIEVMSGPGGALWGANAVNGVISVTSKSAQDTQGFYLEQAEGSALQEYSGARYGGTLAPNVYFRVYAKYMDFEDADLASGGDASDAWKQGQAGFRVDDLVSSHNTFTLQGDVYSGDLDVASGGDARLQGDNVLGRWTDILANGSDIKLQVYYDHTHLSDPFGASPFAPAGLLIDNLDTYDVDFQHHIQVGPLNQLVWGFGYRFTHDDVLQDAPNFGFKPQSLDQTLVSAFAQDEIEFQRDFHLTLGTKVEHNDFTGFEWEPDIRLSWTPSASQNLWAAVSRAVRTPSRLDRNLVEPVNPTLIEGGGNFMSETLIAYELGYRVQFNPRASATISTFYNDYSDLRSLDPTAGTFIPLVYGNNLVGRTYGAEFSATYQVLDWWKLHAGYDLLEEHIWIRAGGVDFYNALDETADPKYQYQIRSSMDLPRGVSLDADLRYVDSLRVDNSGVAASVPAYFELGVRLAWRVSSNLELSVVGENLLHRAHPEYGVSGPGEEEAQRTIFGKAALRF